jgi:hypothetical protein
MHRNEHWALFLVLSLLAMELYYGFVVCIVMGLVETSERAIDLV